VPVAEVGSGERRRSSEDPERRLTQPQADGQRTDHRAEPEHYHLHRRRTSRTPDRAESPSPAYRIVNIAMLEMLATPDGAVASKVTKALWMRTPFKAGTAGMWILALAWL
jgi:hypothetical protein